MTTQTELKAKIEMMAESLRGLNIKPDYSELTRRQYDLAGLLDRYEEHKALGLKATFMSTLPE